MVSIRITYILRYFHFRFPDEPARYSFISSDSLTVLHSLLTVLFNVGLLFINNYDCAINNTNHGIPIILIKVDGTGFRKWRGMFRSGPRKKYNLDQTINDSQSHIWNYLLKILFLSGKQTFYIHPHMFQRTSSKFFF